MCETTLLTRRGLCFEQHFCHSSHWRSAVSGLYRSSCCSKAAAAYVSIFQDTSAYVSIRQHTSTYVSLRQHMSAYVSIRQHTSAYISALSGCNSSRTSCNRRHQRQAPFSSSATQGSQAATAATAATEGRLTARGGTFLLGGGWPSCRAK